MSDPGNTLSPQEIRERLELSYSESYRRRGEEISDEAVRRQVADDLQIVDAARRLGELGDGRQIEPDRAVREKPQQIIDAERQTNTRVVDEGEGERLEFRTMHHDPRQTSEKWAYACGRMQRIFEGVTMSSDFRVAASTCAYPNLAVEALELFWNFTRRSMPAIVGRNNPFMGLSDRDAERMLEARVYSICDRSTGKLGSWYVK